MPTIENAYEIEHRPAEEIIAEAKIKFMEEHGTTDYMYSHLLGVMQEAYNTLALRVDIAHNNKIK
jgi:hypothetical protein